MQVPEFATWGYEALTHYNLPGPSLTFIRHNENITFQVTDRAQAEKYLLRMHLPITENFASAQQRPVELASELLWLDALHRDTSLAIQKPVRNRAGEFVTIIYPEGSAGLYCTLLHWIEGEPLRQNVTAALVEDLGAVVAQLHEHVRSWPIPAGFVRPTYNSEFFRQQAALLRPGIAAGIITAQEYAIVQTLVDSTGELLASLETDRENWGLIHADLHRGNCLVYQDRIRPIDFSLCGFGHFLFDFGSSLPSFRRELRQSYITGYARRRKLPGNYLRAVEAFCVLCRMCSYVFMLPKVSERERLRARIAHFVANECQQFLRNEPVLLAM
ncbi:MAG: phosphotransferase [Ktedonobacteraceae bacterium]